MFEPIRPNPAPYAAACWTLAAIFAGLTAGQAVGPAGSLSSIALQAVLFAGMLAYCWRLQTGAVIPDRTWGKVLAWTAAGTLAFGLGIVHAAPAAGWACAIPHALAAGFLFTVSLYHLRA